VRIRFWGTRGSIATPGPSTSRYGGNTSCIEVRSARGTFVVIDCGTGGRSLAQKLMADDGGRRGNILISHTHWDHIQGIPFFDPLYVPGNEWHVYGPKGLRESVREALAGQMEYTYFPVPLDRCAANIHYHDLVEGSFAIDDVSVSTRYLNHPALTLGYRLQVDGAILVYACDHEPYSRVLGLGEGTIAGEDLEHANFIRGADLLIHDAQYTAQEYPTKMGWGHSPVEYVVKLAEQALVKRVALTHHDPHRDDDAIDRLIASTRQRTSVDIFAAQEGQVVELKPHHAQETIDVRRESAEIPGEQKLTSPVVLLTIADPRVSAALSDALRAESVPARSLGNIDAASLSFLKDRPGLAIIEHAPPRIDGIAFCRALRQHAPERRLPVLLVAEHENADAGTAAGVSDWLIKPFTTAHVRTKVRTWLLRNACKRIRRRSHVDETRPLPVLRLVSTGGKRAADKIEELVRVLEKVSAGEQRGISSDKADLLWMYGREIAAFDTPAFTNQLGRIVAEAASRAAHKPVEPYSPYRRGL
jgi:phosphoribosyl 1,2-cyclic phosphodiesterase/FixJ family two-component response regulator